MKPEVGQFFYDGLNRLSYMLENDYYQAVGFKRPWIYIPESKIFSCSRLATIGDMVKAKDQENEMNTEFTVTLANGHDTTKGLHDLEAKYIEHVYSVSKYNQVRAAKNLGISRGCLRMKLKEYFGDKYL